jgi:hypothetical protein
MLTRIRRYWRTFAPPIAILLAAFILQALFVGKP